MCFSITWTQLLVVPSYYNFCLQIAILKLYFIKSTINSGNDGNLKKLESAARAAILLNQQICR